MTMVPNPLTGFDAVVGSQSQGGSLTWVLPRLRAMDSSDSPLV